LCGKKLNFDNRAALSDSTPAKFLVILAALEGQVRLKLVRAYHAAFRGEGRNIGNADRRKAIVDAEGLDGTALEAHARRAMRCNPSGNQILKWQKPQVSSAFRPSAMKQNLLWTGQPSIFGAPFK